MSDFTRPASRGEYRVAIICALPCEANAMDLLFDHIWDEDGGPDPYGPVTGGNNIYTYGRITHVNVVLATLARIGTDSAAKSSAAIRTDFPNLVLGFVVGICGGVPIIEENRDAFLGDVVVSSSVVRYDYGRQHVGSFSIRKDSEDTLRRAPEGVSTILANLRGERQQATVLRRAATHLQALRKAALQQNRRTSYALPELNTDQLFAADYSHKHRAGCSACDTGDSVCDAAVLSKCADICDSQRVIRSAARTGSSGGSSEYVPRLFVGRIGSGNTVMRSAQDRDRLAAQEHLIAFEMESAGAWEEFPCLMVKGICDYADSHKNKGWQDFASATAASVARALIERFVALPVFEQSPRNTQDREASAAVGSGQRLLEGPTTSGNVWGNTIEGSNVNTGAIFGNSNWTTGHRKPY